jgi:small nuclear ribonucleoprotein (snRNP)-like protein
LSKILHLFSNKLPGFKLAILIAVLLGCISLPDNLLAQQVRTITGKITDSQTGEPLPYVTVSVKLTNGTRKGVATNFDGVYNLVITTAIVTDSIYTSYVSYTPSRKSIPKVGDHEINFQLSIDSKMLKAINISPKTYVNPAWEIMAQMVKHKPDNDLQKLKSYQYQSYNRIELSLTNLSEKMKQRKVFKQILPLMDSLKKIAGDEGTPVLPIFASETISDYFYQRDPLRKSEFVKRTKSAGVGIEDETLVSQLIGSTFLQYNFYKNFLRLAGKDFISPLSDSWKTFYNYELVDEHDKIAGKEYYKIEFKPKRGHDLAFNGVMWITKDDYALYRVDASVPPDANLNFLSKVRIQQEMVQPMGTTAWLPDKTRITLNINNLTKNLSGFICKFYLSNSDIEINKDYPQDLFKEPVVMADDVAKKDDRYWVLNRHDSLTVADKRVYQMIDTVKNLPIVKTYATFAGMLINGYYKIGKISLGPYPYTVSHNDLEGTVLRLGGITNTRFSDKWILGGYAGYGFKEDKLKYSASVDYITSRRPWTEVGASYLHDISQTGYQYESFTLSGNNVFNASINNGSISTRGPFFQNVIKAYVQRDLQTTLRAKITATHSTFDPLTPFEYHDPDDQNVYTNYQTSEISAELQWRPGTRQLQSNKINKRMMVGNGADNATFTLRYIHGIKGLGGDFNYDKIFGNIQQKIHMGIWGKGEYSITGGFIPSNVPYTLVENHRFNFNTMRFLEFASDRFVSLTYTQHMDGLITNSIPLLKALNVRTVLVADILEGSLSTTNNEAFRRGRTIVDRSLGSVPYVEVGYGVENILKIIRVDFLYRLTHLDHLNGRGELPDRFAPRVTLQFRL